MKNMKRITIVMWILLLCATLGFSLMHFNSLDYAENEYAQTVKNDSLNTSKSDDENTALYGNSQELPSNMLRISVPLYVSLMQEQNPDKSAADILLDNEKLTTVQKEAFNSFMKSELTYFRENYEKINFYVRDDETGKVYTNNDEIKNYLEPDYTKPDSKTTWYMYFTRDSKGLFSKSDSSSTTSYMKQNTMTTLMNDMLSRYYRDIGINYENNESQLNGYNDSTYQELIEFTPTYKTLKNISIVFEIKEGMISAPSDSYDQQTTITSNDSFMINSYNFQQAPIYLVTLFIIFFAFLILPIKKVKESKLANTFIEKMPLEIMAFGGFLLLVYSTAAQPYNIIFSNMLYYLCVDVNYTTAIASELITAGFVWILYVVLLILSYLLTGACALVIRNAFHEGVENTIKKHSICYKVIKTLYTKITSFDLSNKNNQQILALCALNTIIAFVVMIMSFIFGFTFPIVWILFFLITVYFAFKVYHKIQNNYHNLESFIKEVANGNFDSTFEGDLGPFHSVKDNLQNISSSFEEAVAQEVRSQHLKSELITNVSHDLKTPLTSIISYVDLLQKDDVSEEDRKKYLAVLAGSSERLKHLIEDLFEVSKANSGNVTLNCMDIDIVSLIKQVEMECKQVFNNRHLAIRETYSDDKIMLYLDPQVTYRIIENLMSNASKYAAENTRVFINAENYGSYVEFTMRNISQDELNFHPDEIMERFTRGDKSRNSEGSGLGLAITKSFVELQGGTMHIYIDGDLFKVTIRFPIKNEEN